MQETLLLSMKRVGKGPSTGKDGRKGKAGKKSEELRKIADRLGRPVSAPLSGMILYMNEFQRTRALTLLQYSQRDSRRPHAEVFAVRGGGGVYFSPTAAEGRQEIDGGGGKEGQRRRRRPLL